MQITITKLCLLLALIFANLGHADDTEHLDNTVASGITFKLICLFGREGTWSTMETANPQSFQSAMSSISRDVSHFSDSKRGITMKKESEELISFLSKGVLLTSEPPNEAKPDLEAEKFLRDLGLDPKKADPADLAQIFTDRITAYAKRSKTPTWVYDPSKREQVGTGQPATRPESKSEGGDKPQPEAERRSR
jgi:hypothetical protein